MIRTRAETGLASSAWRAVRWRRSLRSWKPGTSRPGIDRRLPALEDSAATSLLLERRRDPAATAHVSRRSVLVEAERLLIQRLADLTHQIVFRCVPTKTSHHAGVLPHRQVAERIGPGDFRDSHHLGPHLPVVRLEIVDQILQRLAGLEPRLELLQEASHARLRDLLDHLSSMLSGPFDGDLVEHIPGHADVHLAGQLVERLTRRIHSHLREKREEHLEQGLRFSMPEVVGKWILLQLSRLRSRHPVSLLQEEEPLLPWLYAQRSSLTRGMKYSSARHPKSL